MARAMPMTTTPRTGSPGRTISRTHEPGAFYEPVERGFERDLKKAAGVVRGAEEEARAE
jgi:hypothetical protein